MRYCFERGVVILSGGAIKNVIQLLQQLVITGEQFREAASVLRVAGASDVARRCMREGCHV